MNNQTKIDLEIDAIKILKLMLMHGSSVIWTNKMISQSTGIDSVNPALVWLQKKGYLNIQKDEYYITVEGREYYQQSVEHPKIRTGDAYLFRVEVLSGMDQFGHETMICNGALPSTKAPISKNDTPEQQIMHMEHATKIKNSLMETHNLTDYQFDKYLHEGRIKVCKKCEKIGVFDKKGKGRWQPMCRKCRKNA